LKESRKALNEESRPWGGFLVLEDRPTHKVKRIWVHPGQRLSYQKHMRRSEHWIIVEGRARITVDGKEILLGPGESVEIPLEAAHRIENIGDTELTFIEVQTGDYFGEDDIVRLEDDYGRAPQE
jgi:mannose-6-phosphate isomerase